LLDVAVLTFVFPLLDTLIDFGATKVTFSLVLGTLVTSGVFFIGALCMAALATRIEETR
jgi:hypothetical protein